MLKHFLKRDFKTHWIVWAFVLLSGICAFVAVLFTSMTEILFGLAYVYFLIACSSQFMVLGTQWRSQHCMSRYYLLGLPIERKSLFLIMQCRMFVHWVPLLLVLLYIPASYHFTTDGGRGFRCWQEFSIRYYVLYGLGLIAAMVWMISSAIYMQLTLEKVTGYLIQYKRIVVWIKLLGLNAIDIGATLGLAFGACCFGHYIQLLCVIGLIVGACLRYLWTRRVWQHG